MQAFPPVVSSWNHTAKNNLEFRMPHRSFCKFDSGLAFDVAKYGRVDGIHRFQISSALPTPRPPQPLILVCRLEHKLRRTLPVDLIEQAVELGQQKRSTGRKQRGRPAKAPLCVLQRGRALCHVCGAQERVYFVKKGEEEGHAEEEQVCG